MKEVSDKMSEQDMRAVAAYVEALAPTIAAPTDRSTSDQTAVPN
jgi:cytochrome c553